eukprot:scaffold22526_cov101-Isochrysis_galbana.AAC.1
MIHAVYIVYSRPAGNGGRQRPGPGNQRPTAAPGCLLALAKLSNASSCPRPLVARVPYQRCSLVGTRALLPLPNRASARGAQAQSLPIAVRLPRLLHNLLDLALVLAPVLLVQPGRLRVRRRVWVWVAEQRLDRGQDSRDVVNRAPLVLQNVQADGAIGVDWRRRGRGNVNQCGAAASGASGADPPSPKTEYDNTLARSGSDGLDRTIPRLRVREETIRWQTCWPGRRARAHCSGGTFWSGI